MKILLSAGEMSGDLHGSHLIQQLQTLNPEIEFLGLGGDLMQAAGMRVLYHVNQMSIVGITEVIKHLPFLRKVFGHLRGVMAIEKPDLVILIDYPGFNLRFARIAQENGIPVMYYIVPQIWAWGGHRIKKIKKYVDRAAVILPFEAPLLKQAGVEATYVGHPLMDSLNPKYSRDAFFQQHGLSTSNKILGLLPGSRFSEVSRLLPEMLRTAAKLKEKYPELVVLIGKPRNLDQSLYRQQFNRTADFIRILEDETYDIMKYADALLVASGTATLEAALFETPLILVYRTSSLTYFIGKNLIQIDKIGLPNIIAGEEIIPEFIQDEFKAERILPVLEEYLTNAEKNREKRAALSRIKRKMQSTGAAKNAAKIAMEMINSKRGSE